jgi:hypothetical protein
VTVRARLRLAKLLALDEGQEERVMVLVDECLDIVYALLTRYERAGDLASAAVLAEGAVQALEGWHPGVKAMLRKMETYESTLDRHEKEQVWPLLTPDSLVRPKQLTCAD